MYKRDLALNDLQWLMCHKSLPTQTIMLQDWTLVVEQVEQSETSFQVLLSTTNDFIQHYSFVGTQLNSFNYCYIVLIIQFNINHLCAHS